MAEKPYDAGNVKDVQERKKDARGGDATNRDILRGIMSNAEGRRWVYYFLFDCHMFHSSFDIDASITAFREGERNVGLTMQANLMRACPDLYLKMIEEQSSG